MKKAFILLIVTIPIFDIFLFFWMNNIISFIFGISEVIISGYLGVLIFRNSKFHLFKHASELTQSFVEITKNFTSLKQNISFLIFNIIGSFLLIIPGYYSDFIGLFLILPFFKTILRKLLFNILTSKSVNKSSTFNASETSQDIIDGDFYHIKDIKDINYKKNDKF